MYVFDSRGDASLCYSAVNRTYENYFNMNQTTTAQESALG